MKYSIFLLLGVLVVLTGCASLEIWPLQSDETEVKFLLDTDSNEPGILVMIDTPINASADNAGEINITVVNLMKDEIFVEVTDFNNLGHEFIKEGDNEEAWSGRGGEYGTFPDNMKLLKRLHGASRNENGELSTCNCGIAKFKGKMDLRDIDLREWVGADTKVWVPITVYLRRNGRHYYDILQVPVKIINDRSE